MDRELAKGGEDRNMHAQKIDGGEKMEKEKT